MSRRRFVPAALVFVLAGAAAAADAPAPAPARKEPLFRLEAGGFTSAVTALALSRDGKTLYAAGWDKVVRTYRLRNGGTFELDEGAFRVPIGPGQDGTINAIALSPDDRWLAVAGAMPVRSRAGFGAPGLWVPSGSLSNVMWEDRGAVYLFDTRTRDVRALRYHRGPVVALAFAPARPDRPNLLAVAGWYEDATGESPRGTVDLWEADTGTFKRTWWALPLTPPTQRPGLAVCRPRSRPDDVRVVLAWGDGKLHTWDPQRNQTWSVADGQYNSTALALADGETVLTGSLRSEGNGRPPRGVLQEWAVVPGGAPEPRRELAFPPTPGASFTFLKALALGSSRPGGPADLAAMVARVQTPDGGAEYHLRLAELGPRFKAGADVPLPGSDWGLSVLTATPGGDHVAVAGSIDHRVHVYSVGDLLKGPARPQDLRSAGVTLRYAAFATRGKETALLLDEEAPTRPGRRGAPWLGGLLFQFARRSLTTAPPDGGGWKLDEPEMDGWQADRPKRATRDGAARSVVVIRQNDAEKGQVELKPGHTVQALALLPPRPPLATPLLALAWADEHGQPNLGLFNAITGDQVRQLTGHSGAVSSLAFSGDGRLLASTGEDQKVAVWSLTNLERSLGKSGGVAGLAVQAARGNDPKAPETLVVGPIQEDSPARGQLETGEVIEELTPEGGPAQHPATPVAFYEALWQTKPGTKVTLKVRPPGGQPRQAVLTLGQGVDERQPLLSLFITREGRNGERAWVGWNPAGPYDSSDLAAEHLIGWHFNPADLGRPGDATGTFASADQYRKEYRREGILDDLLAEGNLPRALKHWKERQPPPVPPDLGLWIDEVGPDPRLRDARSQVLVRRPDVTLKLAVNDFPADAVDRVTWRVDDGDPVTFDRPAGLEWTAGLARAAMKPGVHTVRVVLRTREDRPREFAKELLVRYQPPPPVLTPAGPAEQEVRQAAFRLRAKVAAAGGARVKVIQTYKDADGKEHTDTALDKETGPDLDLPLQLRPGQNVIDVVAENAEPLAGFEEQETARRRVVVTLTPERVKVPPPRITLAEVVPLPGDPVEVEPGRPVTVPARDVQVRGKIGAGQNLVRAEWARGDGPWQPLTRFKPGAGGEFDIAEPVKGLRPGEQTVRFRAKTADSDEQEAVLTLTYRPRPPSVAELTGPTGPLYEGKDPRSAKVTARLEPPADGNGLKYTARVLVNGQAQAEAPRIDDKKGTLGADVPLAQRDTSVQVETSVEGGETLLSDPVVITYLSPPRNLTLRDPGASAKSVLDLEGAADSALPLLGVEATVKGKQERDERDITGTETKRLGEGRWQVTLRDVALQPGENTVRLWARNADGRSLQPAELTAVYRPPAPPPAPPAITLVDPRSDGPVTTAERAVSFRVKSPTDLETIELVRETEPPLTVPLKAQAKRGDSGDFEVQTTVPLLLGINRLTVRAANAGGESQASVVVTRIEKPVRVVIDEITTAGANGQTVRPRLGPDGRPEFPEGVKSGRALVSGHVVLDPDDIAQGKGQAPAQVRVFVNGFQQAPVELRPARPGARDRTFEAPLLLNQKGANTVGVEVPELKQEADRRREFTVACAEPVEQRRLHLLIVAVGDQDGARLRERVLRTLRAEPEGEDRFRKEGFEQGYVYGPLTGPAATRSRIYMQLLVIKKAIERRNQRGSANDVVLVYYQGTEDIKDAEDSQPGSEGGHFFLTNLTDRRAPDPASEVSVKRVHEYLDETLGAQVLLLDVDEAHPPGKAQDRVRAWPGDQHVGVFRYSWHGSFERPSDTGLLENLDGAMSAAVRLTDLKALSAAAERYSDSLALDYYLPTPLGKFAFNRRGGQGGR